MKKIVYTLILVSFLVLPVIAVKAVQSTAPPEVDVWAVLRNLVNWVFGLFLIVASIGILISAFYFITAQGDAEKISKARQFLLYAVVGILVAFLSKGLVTFVESLVKGGSPTQ